MWSDVSLFVDGDVAGCEFVVGVGLWGMSFVGVVAGMAIVAIMAGMLGAWVVLAVAGVRVLVTGDGSGAWAEEYWSAVS